MRGTHLWLLATLAFVSVTQLAHSAPMKVLSAPNLLRVGTTENVFVECQDCTGAAITVHINVLSHPTRSPVLATTSVDLNNGNHFQQFGQIMIPTGDFSKDPKAKQYVYLEAQFPDSRLEKVVMVSFQSGYIFIQTDKTLYTPNSIVHYRMFALTPNMEPVEQEEEIQAEASIAIEFVTPDNIVLPLDPASLTAGIHSGNYQLPEIISPGVWKVVAKFHSNPRESFSAEFEVKEYVLPSFEVKLQTSPFFYVDSPDLTVHIKATYLFGEEVDGTAFVVFGVEHDGQKTALTGSLQRVLVDRGKGEVTMKKEHITNIFPNITKLVGSPIFVAVTVLTASGSEMVEAELRGIQIVTSPYTIHFRKTPRYFKPGMTFDLAIEVTNPDDSPAAKIPVVVTPGDTEGVTGENGIAKLTVNTQAGQNLMITARTRDPNISPERQAKATMEALPYKTKSNSYIHIGVDTAELQLGNNLKISLVLKRASNEDTDITILVLSRGQLVQHRRHRVKGQVIISDIMTITKDLLPSFRLIAYYHLNDNEMVSDSVWVDVKDTCMGTLKLEPSRNAPSYEPRKTFGLKVTGNPGATVGLVAVDKGVYVLNNKHRLSQKKVWDIVEKYDTGCTPGGGKDSKNVFYDAGLLFVTSANFDTPYRQELKCPAPSSRRRKRAATLMDISSTLAGQYQDDLERECCYDGMKKTLQSYTCEERSEYIVDGASCVVAFVHCCTEVEKLRAGQRDEELHLARSANDDKSYMDSNEIMSRTNFPESWLWSDIVLPECSPQTPNCDTTLLTKHVPLQDSITTWEFTGISLSRTHGICVGEPLEVIVRKDFFIDLRLPYSAVRGEQLEVKAILHNYTPDPLTVRLELIEEEHLCSMASKHGKFRMEVEIGPTTTKAVPFIIIPMREGEFQVEVKGSVKDSALNDGVRKVLRVVPEGVLVKDHKVVVLNPAEKGVGGVQEEILKSNVKETDIIPNTRKITDISVTGTENIGPLVENAISGTSMGSLIYQPTGCGEQNMIHMTLPVIATTYLDKTKQWDKVGFEKRNEALQHIRKGYQNQIAYRKADGSFGVWQKHASSSWLTAYVAKVFAMANSLVAVQSNVICDAVKYLILTSQLPDGMFKETGRVYHGEMIGDIRGGDSDASMTAFNLIALQESRQLCTATVGSLPGSIDKAVEYLEKHLPHLTNPYAVAISSYALANADRLNREILFNFVSRELDHWPVPAGRLFTLEATGYALLALVKARLFEEARPVVRWFNKQQFVGGGYGSTQATIVVYQAIADYWVSAQEPEYDLNVDVLIEGRTRPDMFHFNRDNSYATRSTKFNDINQDVRLTATGSGEATVTMVSLYYALPKEKTSDCQKFQVTVKFTQEEDDAKMYKLMIEILYLNKDQDSTMTVVDVGLLTGFTVNTADLDALSKGRARQVAKYEMDKLLSERGSLIIYLDKVSHTRPEEITFRLEQTMEVGVMQPATISVYEYYDQRPCMKFYHPQRQAGQLLQLCRGENRRECTCAEENCSMQKKGEIDNGLRTEKLCETTATTRIDFAYKVMMEEFADGLSTDIYTVRIISVIKEGSFDVDPRGQLRVFLSYPHCRESLAFAIGKMYLIMGTSKDIGRDEENQTYQYVLGERSWIEYWPTDAECQTDEHKPACVGFEQMVQQYRFFGCQQ